ncbi:MAG: aminoglycoside phosphotransferase family protein [Candidatus Cloacimonetes bacterium]|jgi:aminoglycoside phosphotransferase|nr:aminoglycoside phosphotransferase family protein [Candidatus Cloacimonadota bacterium]
MGQVDAGPADERTSGASQPDGQVCLLKSILGLDEHLPVYATPGFASWCAGNARWPPPSEGDALLLIDTRDSAALRDSGWRSHARGTSVLLVLGGAGRPGSPARRLARRVLRRERPRLSESRARALLDSLVNSRPVHRLGFDDGAHVPDTFTPDAATSSGAALLVMDRPPFDSGPWPTLRSLLGDPEAKPREVHLRARGAAVAIMEAARGDAVVRIVPAGRFQDVVERNHQLLIALRERLRARDDLLALLPRPLFLQRSGGLLLLAETRLTGVLAWTVARGELLRVIRRNMHEFLAALRGATLNSAHIDDARLDALLAPDQSTTVNATFVAPDVRDVLQRELEHARRVLRGRRLDLHASHGDFGWGNVLVEPETGQITGVIDWDTARLEDLPGIDRVNLEIQFLRARMPFPAAVAHVWNERLAHDGLGTAEQGHAVARALFGLAVVRYVTRAMSYPELYAQAQPGFRRALRWLSDELRP